MSNRGGLSGFLFSSRFIRPLVARGAKFPEIENTAPPKPRPKGVLVWLHVASNEVLATCDELIDALTNAEQNVLVTTDGAIKIPEQMPDGVIVEPLGEDTHAAAKLFLRHWQPDLCIWAANALRTRLILRASRLGLEMIYVNAAPHQQPKNWRRWLPNFSGVLLSCFSRVLAVSTESKDRLVGFGLDEALVEVTGSLQTLLGAKTLPVVESERATCARHVSDRPVWLVIGATVRELSAIAAAHKQGARMAQRLLMIIQPADLSSCDAVAKELVAKGLKVERRSQSDLPKVATDVFLADIEDEAGLWYRIAPVTFFGGSLSSGMVNNPFEAAALGSAILHGGKHGEFAAACLRLGDAGAAREVEGDTDLGAALSQTVAPDAAAELAHAAWQVSSAGAEVNDRMLELVNEMLNAKGPTK